MTCHEIDQSLVAYLNGEVGRSERELIRAHVAQCERCQHELAKLSVVQSHLSRALHDAVDDVKPSPYAWARLQAGIALQRQPTLADRLRHAFSVTVFSNASTSRSFFILASALLVSAMAISTAVLERPARVATTSTTIQSTSFSPRRFSGPIDEESNAIQPVVNPGTTGAYHAIVPPDPDVNTTAFTNEWLFLLGAAEEWRPSRACANCTQLQ